MRAPFEACPRFKGCSVNVCPLDPEQHLRNKLPDEPDCSLAKADRVRVAERFPGVLHLGGLTPREHAGALAWSRRSEEERRAFQDAGEARLLARRTTIEATPSDGASVCGGPGGELGAEEVTR